MNITQCGLHWEINFILLFSKILFPPHLSPVVLSAVYMIYAGMHIDDPDVGFDMFIKCPYNVYCVKQ